MVGHLYELVRERSQRYPTDIALGGQQGLSWKTVTSLELLDLVDRLALELSSRGVTDGDRVILWLPNHWKTPVYLFALWKLGAIAIPFDRETNPEAATNIVSVLTKVVLIVQFVAFVGALTFNYLAVVVGAKRALVVSLLIWAGTLLYTYSLLRTTAQVFVVAAVIAMALGGSQALSRSLYSLMIPRGQEAEYFSLYVVSSGGTSWLGPLLFGLALQLTGSYRIAIVSLVSFFALGLVLLARVNVRRAAADAGNSVPSQLLVRGSKGDLEVASG
jgi:hypothetical protein